MTNKRRDDSGFTLVELLIVITIISILAAIALPVFMTQRQKGYKAAMASDLHSVITSELAWSADNNGAYTTDPTQLATEGYRTTNSVAAHLKVTGATYVACTKHSSYAAGWLVFDSATGVTTKDAADCA